jgi:hypothetical protein
LQLTEAERKINLTEPLSCCRFSYHERPADSLASSFHTASEFLAVSMLAAEAEFAGQPD